MSEPAPGFYWGRLQAWCSQTSHELGGNERWEPLAVQKSGSGLKAMLLGDDELFDLDEVELGERLVRDD